MKRGESRYSENLTWEIYRDVLIQQAEPGRGLFYDSRRRETFFIFSIRTKRLTGIGVRGGAIHAKWCMKHHKENFLYTHFEEIVK